MKTIKLTQEDSNNLLVALGYANAASLKQTGSSMFLKIADRILVQLGAQYTYEKKKSEVIEEMRKDGIEI